MTYSQPNRYIIASLLYLFGGFVCLLFPSHATTTHEYDALGRLVVTEYVDDHDSVIDRGIEYSYDAAGNRTRAVTSGDQGPPNNAPRDI